MDKIIVVKWNDGQLNGVVFSTMDKAVAALRAVVGEGPFVENDDWDEEEQMNFDELVDFIKGNKIEMRTLNESDNFYERGDDYVEVGIFEVSVV